MRYNAKQYTAVSGIWEATFWAMTVASGSPAQLSGDNL